MRRFDKDKNIHKVNLLSEQRYLKSKGLLSEDFNPHRYSLTVGGEVSLFPKSLTPFVVDTKELDYEDADYTMIKLTIPKNSEHSWAKIMVGASSGDEAEGKLLDRVRLGKEQVGVEGRPGQAIGFSDAKVEDGGDNWDVFITTGHFLDV